MPPVKRLVVSLLLVVSLAPLFGFSVTTNRTSGADLLTQIPVVEAFNLKVDGSITPQHFTPNETFLYLERVIWTLHFTDNAIDYDLWGSGAALTNGTAMFYDAISLLPFNITNIHEFGHASYDFNVFRDEKNPKDNHITSRYSFNKFVPPGLFMPGHTFTVIVQDNITAAANDIDMFDLTLEGYSVEDDQPIQDDKDPDIFRQTFSEKALVFPSPLYALGLIFLVLAAFLVFYKLVIK